MKNTIKHGVTWSTIACSTALLLMVITLWLGPKIESRFFPVVNNTSGLIIQVSEKSTKIIVTGQKIRSCLTMAMQADVLVDGKWITGKVQFLKEDGSQLTIPEGRITAGTPYVRQLEISPASDVIRLNMESQCHPFWITQEHIVTLAKISNTDNQTK